jgi:uncharacterized membrane protein
MNYFQSNQLDQDRASQYQGYSGNEQSQQEYATAQYYEHSNPQQPDYQPYPHAGQGPPHQQGGFRQQANFIPPSGQAHYANYHTSGTYINLAAGLSYLGFWLTGLLFLLFYRKDRFVHFHAMQSLLFFGGVNILYFPFITIINAQFPLITGFAIFGFVIMNIVATVAWLVGIFGAFRGKYVKLPIVGDMALRYINNEPILK